MFYIEYGCLEKVKGQFGHFFARLNEIPNKNFRLFTTKNLVFCLFLRNDDEFEVSKQGVFLV